MLARSLLVVSILALLAWLFLLLSDDQPTPAGAAPGSGIESVSATARPARQIAASRSAVDTPDPATTGEVRARVLVRGRVRSEGAEVAQTKVQATLDPAALEHDLRPWIAEPRACDGAGAFEIDVTLLLSDARAWPSSVRVVALHPQLATAAVDCPITFARERLFDAVELELLAQLELSVRREIIGQVWTVEETSEPMMVGVFECRPNGSPMGAPRAMDYVERDGRFRLAVDRGGSFAFVALCRGFRPSTRALAFGHRSTADLGRVALDRGERILGSLRHRGETVPSTAVTAFPAQASAVNMLFGNAIAWCADNFEWPERTATTDAEGRFEFDQLGPREYELWPIGFSAGQQEPAAILSAPAEEARLDVLACTVELYVSSEGRPAPKIEYYALLELSGVDALALRTQRSIQNQRMGPWGSSDADGQASFRLAPGVRAQVWVGMRRLEVPGCDAGASIVLTCDL